MHTREVCIPVRYSQSEMMRDTPQRSRADSRCTPIAEPLLVQPQLRILGGSGSPPIVAVVSLQDSWLDAKRMAAGTDVEQRAKTRCFSNELFVCGPSYGHLTAKPRGNSTCADNNGVRFGRPLGRL